MKSEYGFPAARASANEVGPSLKKTAAKYFVKVCDSGRNARCSCNRHSGGFGGSARPWPAQGLLHGNRQLLNKSQVSVGRNGHVRAAHLEVSGAQGFQDRRAIEAVGLYLDVNRPVCLPQLMQIDPEIGRAS